MEKKGAKYPGVWLDMLTEDPNEKTLIAFVLGIAIGTELLTIMSLTISNDPGDDSYSVALTAVNDFSRPAGVSGDMPLSPAFNVTLYLKNSRILWKSCFSHGKVAVSYDGVAMGDGLVPGWCAAARSTAEVSAAARGVGVQLPDGLRKRMEAELRWGSAEVDVEVKLFRDDEAQNTVLL
ncbi:hypothetical protein EJB05_38757, partial [Eragrostis curvula]